MGQRRRRADRERDPSAYVHVGGAVARPRLHRPRAAQPRRAGPAAVADHATRRAGRAVLGRSGRPRGSRARQGLPRRRSEPSRAARECPGSHRQTSPRAGRHRRSGLVYGGIDSGDSLWRRQFGGVGGVAPRFDAPAVTVDLTDMGEVLEIDAASRAARIQAGALGPDLENQLRPHGLTLRHFPQSFGFSTRGGWLAARAGGHFATLYTHIDDLTEALRVVTPAGVSESRRLPGSGAGPSPDRMFLGSEGALGAITEAWMRLHQRPRWHTTASITFDDWPAAVAATRSIAQAGLYPTNCRLLDSAEALLNAGTAVAGGLLVLAFESADHPVTAWMERAVAITGEHNGTVIARRERTADATDAPATCRSSFLPLPYQRYALARRSGIAETFETACTWGRFEDLHAAVTEAARSAVERVCGAGVVTCRFTHVYPDGPAPYYGIYGGGRWDTLVEQWDEIKAAVSDAIIAHGGTITHHHAVGRDHRPWYDRQRPEPFASAPSAMKGALDPAGILNPGVLIDP